MSLKTRLSLMAGSSLVAAAIAATAFTGAALAPVAAYAADECTPVPPTLGNGPGPISDDPTLNGATADSFACSATTYATGITYTANGPLTVTKANTTATNVTANGINLTASGADSVTFNSTAGFVGGGAGTAGPVIDVVSDSGAIDITTLSVSGATAGTTHAIRAVSNTGDISISRSGGSVWNAGGVDSFAVVEAISNGGGDIAIISTGTFNTTGRLRGIRAQTNGAGTITVSLASTTNISNVDGVATIETQAASGATVINLTGGALNAGTNATAVAIRSTSTSSTAVSIQNTGAAVNGPVDFSGVTAGGVIFSNTGPTTGTFGRWNATRASVFSNLSDTLIISGGNSGFGNHATLAAGASISFGGGADTFNLTSAYGAAAGTLDFGAGADVFNVSGALMANGTAINFGADGDALNASGLIISTDATFDFGSGADTYTQDGILNTNSLTTFNNLEAFNNTGQIYFGSAFLVDSTDGSADDRLRMPSGVFTGSGDSLMVLDAGLGSHPSQIGCSAAVVADCADFTGAATAGSTAIRVTDVSFDVNSGTFGTVVTLVDGSSAADHFVLDPGSSFYAETAAGAAIRKPVVAYYFVYDEANQRHVLVGAPAEEPFQVGTFAAAAQETWRATTSTWLGRQADLRSTPGGIEPSYGLWGRIGAQSGERETAAAYSTGGVSLDFDLTQKQRIAHLSFGGDIIGGAGWVIGATAGFVRSDVEFEAGTTEAIISGPTGGLYASYVDGPLFLDGIFNANILHVKADAPALGIGDDVPMTLDLKSLGGQLEGGWRIPVGAAFVEPLAAVSYVVTMTDDANVPGGSGLFEFDKSTSLRYGAGARVGMDSELMGLAASYSLTGRYWSESDGEGSATITTASGSSALLVDEFGGNFSEVMASLNLYSGEGGVSGFVNIGGKFGDDYQAADGSIGVRVRW